jgi:hypothetical protein
VNVFLNGQAWHPFSFGSRSGRLPFSVRSVPLRAPRSLRAKLVIPTTVKHIGFDGRMLNETLGTARPT